MQLATLVRLLELEAGGKGSGCNPEVGKCGRPRSAEAPEGFIPHSGKNYQPPKEDTSKKPGPEPLGNVGVLKITDKNKLDLLPPAKKSNLSPSNQDEKFPKEKPKSSDLTPGPGGLGKYAETAKEKENLAKIGKNDKVIVMVPLKVFHEKKMQFITLPVGTEATVLGIEPRNGIIPAKVILQPGKKYGEEKLNIEDVYLFKKGKDPDEPKIDPKPVQKSKVQSSYKDQDGAQVTILKPSSSTDDETRGKWKPHGLIGKFQEVTGQVKDLTDPMVRRQVFSANPNAAIQLNDKLMGTTVIVERNYQTKQTTITRLETGRYGQMFSNITERVYNNHGAASGYLKKRFGISQKLPKDLKVKS